MDFQEAFSLAFLTESTLLRTFRDLSPQISVLQACTHTHADRVLVYSPSKQPRSQIQMSQSRSNEVKQAKGPGIQKIP